jgi:hypothetical protein
MTQVADTIYSKYFLRQVDLIRAVKHFQLDNDPEVVKAKQENS